MATIARFLNPVARLVECGTGGYEPANAGKIRALNIGILIVFFMMTPAILLLYQQNDFGWQKSADMLFFLQIGLLPVFLRTT